MQILSREFLGIKEDKDSEAFQSHFALNGTKRVCRDLGIPRGVSPVSEWGNSSRPRNAENPKKALMMGITDKVKPTLPKHSASPRNHARSQKGRPELTLFQRQQVVDLFLPGYGFCDLLGLALLGCVFQSPCHIWFGVDRSKNRGRLRFAKQAKQNS